MNRILAQGCPHQRYLSSQGSSDLLPQTVDLLDTYRGLVALGRIKFDEDQVRVILEVRASTLRSLLAYRTPHIAQEAA